MHQGWCRMSGRHTHAITRDEALRLPAEDSGRACQQCRPDTDLGVLRPRAGYTLGDGASADSRAQAVAAYALVRKAPRACDAARGAATIRARIAGEAVKLGSLLISRDVSPSSANEWVQGQGQGPHSLRHRGTAVRPARNDHR
ncbi:DUF6233 domain-containing protein [Streptomyces sp. NPDC006516]|uniref:DUF6233 domain-containing protein n=1 Tax=Streptomyces sp. NPDC006516 TaxID=3154309 RepID=UPI0033A0CA25